LTSRPNAARGLDPDPGASIASRIAHSPGRTASRTACNPRPNAARGQEDVGQSGEIECLVRGHPLNPLRPQRNAIT
jgi:hypothetical protein